MTLLTDPTKYLQSIATYKHSILDSYGYKKILNDHYAPDEYLLFSDSHTLVPLVRKNDLVTFFGGTQHNHYNTFPLTPTGLKTVLEELTKNDLKFRLLSMTQDPMKILPPDFQKYDVPLPVTWIYKNIQSYDEAEYLAQLKGKKKWYMKRTIGKKNNYSFEKMDFADFRSVYQSILYKHNRYFRDRGKKSVWENNENLLLDILEYFDTEEKLCIVTIQRLTIVGIYILVYNDNEMIYYFGTSLDYQDNEISKILYLDMLEKARDIARTYDIMDFDALPGGFSNKKRFLFFPVPLYGLVNDPDWVVKYDPELTAEEYDRLLKRD